MCSTVSPGDVARTSSVGVVDSAVCYAAGRRSDAGGTRPVDDDRRQPADGESADRGAETDVSRLGRGGHRHRRSQRQRRCSAGELHSIRGEHRTVVHRARSARRLRNVSSVASLIACAKVTSSPMPVCPSVCLSVCLSVRPSVCLSVNRIARKLLIKSLTKL